MAIDSKVVFVGAGNMAEAIVSGMISGTFCAPSDIVLTDIREDRLADLEKQYGVRTSTDNGVVAGAEIVVLSVKPQIMADVLSEMSPILGSTTLVISIAAGVSASRIEAALGGEVRVVRVMPNTPALIGMGASGIAAGCKATDDDMVTAEAVLGCVGLTVRVKESELDAVTALSGSGPAYVFYLLESMLAAAGNMGLESETARILALQTVEGAARLMKDSGEGAAELRAKVTSKGGTTAAAMESMESAGIKGSIIQALIAARDRSVELSK